MTKSMIVPVVLIAGLALASACGARKPAPAAESSAVEPEKPAPAPVHAEVAVFLLATCPHCAQALRTLLPLRRELNGAMAMTFAYVGTAGTDGSPDVASDTPELRTAVLEVCAGITHDTEQWMRFMECAYRDDTWQHLEAGFDRCAQEAGLDKKEVRACVESGEGKEQLSMSYAIALAEGIDGAPVVFIDGRQYVGPMERESLLAHLCYAAGSEDTRPDLCDGISAPPSVAVALLTDTRCAAMADCQVDREVAFLQTLLPGMAFATLDFGTAEGRALYDRIVAAGGPTTLPIVHFNAAVADHASAVAILEEYLVAFDDGYLLPLGRHFDPTKEICDNGADDDGNGQVDCADASCEGRPACRPEEKNRIDLFMMSQCPFSAMMVPAADHVVAHLRANGAPDARFRFQFIGREEDGAFTSLHGDAEVAEDLRMACVQELYGADHAFLPYFLCRAKDLSSEDWASCLSGKMKQKAIEKCATGEQGHKLLSASFTMAQQTGIQASPSLFLNNRFEAEGRTPAAILQAFCEKNESPACAVPIRPLLIDRATETPQKCE